jgi:outer membrane protein assembly factor BamB
LLASDLRTYLQQLPPIMLRIDLFVLSAVVGFAPAVLTADDTKDDPTAIAIEWIGQMQVAAKDWPMWGGTPARNNTPEGVNIPTEWDVASGENILWKMPLGSQTYGNPTVANGKVYVGTNNQYGYIKRFPKEVDLGCFICLDEKTGEFLWQHSSPKLPAGRVHDWPEMGICAAPVCEGDRVWFVSSRGEVLCLDAEGFRDGENDGPFKAEDNENQDEADIVWRYDMMGEMGVSQHNMCSCSVTSVGDTLFVCTSNGVDESHINIPAPRAPSFFGMNRQTGKVLWTDKSPGLNILHGQWSSPTYGEFNGVPQVMFAGGDAWLYSFAPEGDGQGNAKLLWKFDCNPKESHYIIGGRGTRNEIIATPVVYDGYVYMGVGQDPEHGEGIGHLWCIDPARAKNDGGDVSTALAVDADGNLLPHRRLQAIDTSKGEKAIPNPANACVWHYATRDLDGNGKISFEETMHRSMGTVAVKDDFLYISDFSGLFHCVAAKNVTDQVDEFGVPCPEVYWTYDMFAAAWGSPLIVENKVYVGDEDGDIAIFNLGSLDGQPIAEVNMENSVYSSPIVANDVLIIANKDTIYAIKEGAQLEE